MEQSKDEGSAGGGFFSKLFGKSKPKVEVSVEDAASQLREKLANATSTTLSECQHIIAIAILHELPMQPSYSVRKIAGLFVDQYKKPGWIPNDLELLNAAGVESIHRETAGQMPSAESNQILADKLATMVKPKAVASCSAIAFSGDNPALGHTFFAVVAV